MLVYFQPELNMLDLQVLKMGQAYEQTFCTHTTVFHFALKCYIDCCFGRINFISTAILQFSCDFKNF
jgi:hypothetical protein